MNKILLIEDEEGLRKKFGEFCVSEGYDFFSAADGEQGLEVAEEKVPDVILLDIVLPKKNGFQVLEGLKNNPRLKDIPVIILTNLEGPQDIEKALSMGASAYLIKVDYSPRDIMNKVREILAARG